MNAAAAKHGFETRLSRMIWRAPLRGKPATSTTHLVRG